MKRAAPLFGILGGILLLLMTPAYAKKTRGHEYLEGTVVRVEEHQTPDRAGGENPGGAPVADPETYTYDIAVQVNCGTYVGRYQSWYEYVPSLFAPNQKIHLRLTRGVIYVSVPNERQVELKIVNRHVERGPCEIAKR